MINNGNEEIQLIKDADSSALAERCKELFNQGGYLEAEYSIQFELIRKVLDKFIENNLTDPLAFQLRGECRMKLGKYIQSLHDMEQAMLLDPSMECCKSSKEHYEIKRGLMRMSNDI